MFWALKVLAPAAMLAGITLGTIGLAQPPRGEGPPDREGPPRPGRRTPLPPGGPERGFERPDAAVDAWVKVLTDKIADPHDTIRESARAALVSVGRPALPALQKLADSDDGAKSTAARKLMAAIERGGPRGPGLPGFGPGEGPPDGAPGFPPDERPGAGRDQPLPRPGGDRDGPPTGRRGDAAGRPNPLDRILAELDLTEKQKRQVEEIKESHRKKAQEVLEKARAGQIERQEVREQMDKLGADVTRELKELLTPEQAKRLEDLAPAGRPLFPPPFPPGRGSREAGGPPGGPPDERPGARRGPDGPPPRPDRDDE